MHNITLHFFVCLFGFQHWFVAKILALHRTNTFLRSCLCECVCVCVNVYFISFRLLITLKHSFHSAVWILDRRQTHDWNSLQIHLKYNFQLNLTLFFLFCFSFYSMIEESFFFLFYCFSYSQWQRRRQRRPPCNISIQVIMYIVYK